MQLLIETLLPDVRAINEPKRQACGVPDYILTKKNIPIRFIEAKDIGDKDLDGIKKTGNKKQFDHYKASLPNLIFTDKKQIKCIIYTHIGIYYTRIPKKNHKPKQINRSKIAKNLDLIYNSNPKNGFETGKDIILNAIKNNPNGFEPKSIHSLLNLIDILDYIYAVLHCPTYRSTYKEFLKIDFPRLPYPTDPNIFWQLVKLDTQIRQIHLLESPIVHQKITQYPIDGDNVVIKPKY